MRIPVAGDIPLTAVNAHMLRTLFGSHEGAR